MIRLKPDQPYRWRWPSLKYRPSPHFFRGVYSLSLYEAGLKSGPGPFIFVSVTHYIDLLLHCAIVGYAFYHTKAASQGVSSDVYEKADKEFNELLEHNLGDLDVVKSRTDGQDMSEELLGVVLAPADDTLSTLVFYSTPVIGGVGTAFRDGLVPGVLSFSFPFGSTQNSLAGAPFEKFCACSTASSCCYMYSTCHGYCLFSCLRSILERTPKLWQREWQLQIEAQPLLLDVILIPLAIKCVWLLLKGDLYLRKYGTLER